MTVVPLLPPQPTSMTLLFVFERVLFFGEEIKFLVVIVSVVGVVQRSSLALRKKDVCSATQLLLSSFSIRSLCVISWRKLALRHRH